MPKLNSASMELIELGKPGGDTARRMMALGSNVNDIRRNYQRSRLRANATTLRKDDWERVDRAIVTLARAPQVITDFLLGYNGGLLRHPLDGFAQTILSYDTVSDTAPAELNMRPSMRSANDRQKYDRVSMPLPFIFKDFDLDVREVAMSQRLGSPIDTSLAEDAGFQVADMVEDVVINGRSTAMVYKSAPLYGLLDFEHINDVTIGEAWTASGKTGEQMVDDVMELILASTSDHRYGPWALWLPDGWRAELSKRCYPYDSRTVAEVIRAIVGIVHVDVAPKLPINTPVLVELQPNTIQIVEGLPISNLPWEGPAPFEDLHHKVITMRLPRPKADQEGRCGICKGTVTP